MVSSNLKVAHLSMTDFVILIRQHDIPCSMGQPGGKWSNFWPTSYSWVLQRSIQIQRYQPPPTWWYVSECFMSPKQTDLDEGNKHMTLSRMQIFSTKLDIWSYYLLIFASHSEYLNSWQINKYFCSQCSQPLLRTVALKKQATIVQVAVFRHAEWIGIQITHLFLVLRPYLIICTSILIV